MQLTKETIDAVVAALPEPVKRMLRMSRLFLAGGFIRTIVAGESVAETDIDIFGPDVEELKRYAKLLSGERYRHQTKNAITVRLAENPIKVQFIKRWLFSDPQKLLESFDFTIAQAVIWFDPQKDEWCGICSGGFYLDTNSRALVYTSPTREEDAAGSLLRVNRFLGRGYYISDEDLAKVVARVGEAARQAEVVFEFEENRDPVEPYRRVIRGARTTGGY